MHIVLRYAYFIEMEIYMIEFITGPSGSGKSTLMLDKICDLLEKNEEVCVIVPEQYSHDFDKKLYFRVGAEKFNALTSLSFTGLARQLFQLYGEKNRSGEYADEFARKILIHLTISSVQKKPESMQYFRKLSSQPGFAEDMLNIITEMKRSGISPEKLVEKSIFFDNKLKNKMNDISIIYLEYEKLMAEYGYKDNLDDLKEASQVAGLNGYFNEKNVFFDEFESFTGDQINFIQTIISSAKNLCITLRTDDVTAGEYTLFETVNRTYRSIVSLCREYHKEYRNIVCNESYRFKNKDIKYLSIYILRNRRPAPETPPSADNITIFEAKTPYNEAEYVCASIKRLIYNNPTMKYRDIAVISNNINDYAEILKTAFERYEIPYFLSIEKPVTHTSLMTFFCSLLDIISQKKYDSELLFRYMKCGLLGIELTDISLLENYCYKWSIDDNIWKQPFTAPDDNLQRLENLRASVIGPLEKLRKRNRSSQSAKNICIDLYEFLVECKAEHNLAVLMSRLIKENKDYEAAEIKRLWGCLIDILDSIADTLDESEIAFSKLSDIIKSMIGGISYSVPPQTLDSVTAASARTARLSAPKVVFIMGANDGDFPNTVKLRGLFSEEDKYKLLQNGIEISRPLSDVIASERLVVYKSLSSSSDKLYITYPLSDLSGQAKYPASIIEDIYALFGCRTMLRTESDINIDYYSVTMKSAFYHYMQNKSDKGICTLSVEKMLTSSPDYRRKIDYILMRSNRRNEFKISSDIMEKLRDFSPLKISPSGFELYNICHFRYFCRECLRLFINEKIELDVRFAGSLIHLCFYNIISSRSKDDFIKLPYNLLKDEIFNSAETFRNSEMGGEFAKTPRFELAFNKLTERLVKVFVHAQEEIMASSFVPIDFEINLRDKKRNSSLELKFADNKTLSFGGIIDRADVCTIDDTKYVRIIDYKSGSKQIDAVSLSNGINMQMLLYLFSITENDGLFKDCTPAGVLYSPVSIRYVKSDETRDITENISAIDNSLRTSGLILSDKSVLEAMEHDIQGRYVPVKLDKNNEIDKNSDCITADGFTRLKELTYQKLIEMAESLYSGNADASPLIFSGKSSPCDYCEFINICGNNSQTKCRIAEDNVMPEIEKILETKTLEADNNGLD